MINEFLEILYKNKRIIFVKNITADRMFLHINIEYDDDRYPFDKVVYVKNIDSVQVQG